MKKLYIGSISLVLILAFAFLYAHNHDVKSTPSTNVKDVLTTSQLSYFGRLGIGTSAYETLINMDTGKSNPSQTTSNLFSGDIVGIAKNGGGGLDMYTVRDIANTGIFAIVSTINPNNIATVNIVVATRSAVHTVYFTPKSNITNGAWQFLIKAASRIGETSDDGMPDQTGFDLGADVGSTTIGIGTRLKVADISCPFGTASIGTTVVIGTNTYHNILCSLSGGETNPIDVGVTLTIGRDLTVGSQLINPSPATSHIEGTAGPIYDVYSFFVRHLDAARNNISVDTAAGKIAVVESVRVTATVDPNLTFIIDVGSSDIGIGGTACGNTAGNSFGLNAADTTATAVAFGSLNINAFNNLAQRLSCVTNANSGYVVTVYQNSQMKNLNSGVTIPDTTCDGGACNYTTAQPWDTDFTHSKWGYTMQNVSVGITSTTFDYNTGYKAFGVGFVQAQEIMRNTSTPFITEQAYICYRLSASTVQQAGNYENKLTYTATATF